MRERFWNWVHDLSERKLLSQRVVIVAEFKGGVLPNAVRGYCDKVLRNQWGDYFVSTHVK